MQEIITQLITIVLSLITMVSAYLMTQQVPVISVESTPPSDMQQVINTGGASVTTTTATVAPSVSVVQDTATAPAAPTPPSAPSSTGSDKESSTVSTIGSSTVVVSSQAPSSPTTLTSPTNSADTSSTIKPNTQYGAAAFVQESEVAGALFVALNGNDGNPGTKSQPFATIQHALDVVQPGGTIYVRGGTYTLDRRILTKNSGRSNAWITIAGYPGETPVLDATNMDLAFGGDQYSHDLGAFLVTNNVEYVRVQNLTVKNSPGSGFSICRGRNIILEGNTINGSYTPGISTNSTFNHDCSQENITIRYNTLINTNNLDFGRGAENDGEAPHEAISIMGAKNVEIAYNHIHDTMKEGIDVKERSSFVTVHHNLVENIARQCFYVDAWFGTLHDIEFYANIGRNCGFFGFAISVENNAGGGAATAHSISFHHNLIDSAGGAAVYFSRFAADGERRNIKIFNNTFYNSGHQLGWANGGLTLLSANVYDTEIVDNIFVNNAPFQLGAHTEYGGMSGLAQRNIVVENNLIFGPQGSGDMMDGTVTAIEGTNTITADPLFANPSNGDFTLQPSSPARGAGRNGGNIGAF